MVTNDLSYAEPEGDGYWLREKTLRRAIISRRQKSFIFELKETVPGIGLTELENI